MKIFKIKILKLNFFTKNFKNLANFYKIFNCFMKWNYFYNKAINYKKNPSEFVIKLN